MKQIVQNLKSGNTILQEVPIPKLESGEVLIRTTRSLVSLGTEKMLVAFGKASLVSKARQQPEKVKLVIDKMKSDGIFPTLENVFRRLDEPLPLGYCNVGVVEAVGDSITHFQTGQRVISNGPHAQYVAVNHNLVCHIPDNVSDDDASFTVVGAIGLQGIRLIKPTLGETVVVIGLGLIGLLTAQLLSAHGCNVIGVDLNPEKVKIAQELGIATIDPLNNIVQAVNDITNQVGSDGVIITASSLSNEIISQSAQMCRKRGRIVLIGVVGLNLSRSDFYEKELTFQVSCSYGPGRYDDIYEEKGMDYPLPYVRWTEKRNFEAILQMINTGKLQLSGLITQREVLMDFQNIYHDLSKQNAVASIIEYPDIPLRTKAKEEVTYNHRTMPADNTVRWGIIGAGNFSKMTLLPNLKSIGVYIKYIVSKNGLSGTNLANKFGIPHSVTDFELILKDPEVTLVLVTTRHHLHAPIILECLEKGKSVFVEKPLSISDKELDDVTEKYHKLIASNQDAILSVGFNRRFAPLSSRMKTLLGSNPPPLNLVITVNAGFIPKESWVHDLEIGGGRIIGEACHFIDFALFLTASPITRVLMTALGTQAEKNTDNASMLLKHQNGSNTTINYFSNGHRSFAKESITVFFQGKTLFLDNFRKLTGYGFDKFKSVSQKQNKGHREQFQKLFSLNQKGGDPLISFSEILNVHKTAFGAVQSLVENKWIEI